MDFTIEDITYIAKIFIRKIKNGFAYVLAINLKQMLMLFVMKQILIPIS